MLNALLFAAESSNGDIDIYERVGTTDIDLTSSVTGGIGEFFIDPTVLVDGSDPGAFPLLIAYDDDILFQGNADGDGSNLWVYDTSTHSLSDIAPSNAWSSGLTPDDFVAYAGYVYFVGVDAGGPGQLTRPAPTLWATNGTAGGTLEVETAVTVAGSMAVYDGRLYFNGDDGDGADDLYDYSAATGGVSEVGPANLDPTYLTAAITNVFLGGIFDDLFMSGLDSHGDRGLFVYDGKSVAELTSGDVDPTDLVAMTRTYADGSLSLDFTSVYFAGNDSHGVGLWQANYAGASEVVVSTFGSSTGALGLDPRDLTAVDGLLYFIGDDSYTALGDGSGLFVYNSVSNTTTELIKSSSYNLDPDAATVQSETATAATLAVYDGDLYFNATPADNISNLYEYNPSNGQISLIDVGNYTDSNDLGGANPDALIETTAPAGVYVGGGHDIALTGADADPIALSFTGDDWDTVTGSNGAIFLTYASASIEGGDDIVNFTGAGDGASLYATDSNWDTVNGSAGTVIFNAAQASVVGGGDVLYMNGASSVSLYETGGAWGAVYGSGQAITVNSAEASVVGGGDTLYLGGASSVALSSTKGNWDAVKGSNQTLIIDSAQASVIGGGDLVYLNGASSVSLSATNGAWDALYGSGDTDILTNAQAGAVGGGNIFYLNGASNLSIAGTGGTWDAIYGSNQSEILTNAQAAAIGGGNTLYLNGASSVSLAGTNNDWDAVYGSGQTEILNSVEATLVGNSNQIYLGGANTFTLSGTSDALVTGQALGQDWIEGFGASDTLQFSAADFENFHALQNAMTQQGNNTVITLNATNSVTLYNVETSSLQASQFSFG